MTERLYYADSFLHQFEARVVAVNGDTVTLDRSAFYPTSGGQIFDTGWLEVSGSVRVRVKEVTENEQTGEVLHIVENAAQTLSPGSVVRGTIDAERRLDHMQQHSGQHVLSAAFEKLYSFATVSFHMGEESCTIDLATDTVTAKQLEAAEALANEVIAEDRPVEIRFATSDEARTLGVRKIPPAEREKLRLIDMRDFDLNACGGTHVRSTGQIGGILLRKTEKVKQGVRVEFVCGLRAVRTARHDFETLTEAAACSPRTSGKFRSRCASRRTRSRRRRKRSIACWRRSRNCRRSRCCNRRQSAADSKLVVQFFAERDLGFIKMLAQKLTKAGKAVALLSCGGPQPSLVFAQTPGLANDMGALMKQTVATVGNAGRRQS